MFDWDHCRVVLAVSRTGSLTLAAQQLAMDQTTVGRRLTALEKQLGTTLFIRSKSGFLATESGVIVIDFAQRMETEMEAMNELLSNKRTSPGGVVRFSANTWMLELLTRNAVTVLMHKNPGLELRMSGRLPPAPLFAEPSISLWFDAEPHSPERSYPLCTVPYAAYQNAESVTDRESWLLFRDDLVSGPSFARHMGRRLSDGDKVRLTATDASILLAGARAGLGRATLPVCLGDADPQLKKLDLPSARVDRILHLHVGDDALKLPRVMLVIEWLLDVVEDLFQGRRLASMARIKKEATL